jgi:hypothetical protein
MRHHAVLGLLAAGLLVAALGVLDSSADTTSPAPVADVVGGRHFYFCAAFQAVKLVGLFTANAPLVLAGAIGGGLSCGFGW